MQQTSFIKVFVFSFLVFLCMGYFNSYTSMSEQGYLWYDNLIKTPLTPENKVFGIVWTILYFINALAISILIVNKRFTADGHYEKAIKIFVLQFIVQFFWSYLFWVFQKPLWALINILILDMLVFIMLKHVCAISRLAAFLFIPYFLWLLFASYLNMYIFISN